jgi:N-acetyl-gamma-glutamyl-phosphate/LysW-gamma-L-alpha-aminoadipyl-6-phosphate reductase
VTRLRASIVGASGYVGGELLRLLLGHPHLEVAQATSESHSGKYVYSVHPNLRARTPLTFSRAADVEPCDLLFLALPHGEAMQQIERFAALAPRVVDLSADFRLRDPADYALWYGQEHAAPEWLGRFVYGLPELHREELRRARYVSGVGCNATAINLACYPLLRAGLMDRERGIVVEVKVGSSEGGNKESPGSHHPERSGAVRSFAPTGHRHTAEVRQELTLGGAPPVVHLSGTAVELVRGVVATAHLFANRPLGLKDLWRAYREAYRDEPFVRLVTEKQGIYRYPEPKILAGSNFADVGFALDEDTGRVVAIAAIDNLMKGAAGSAIQAVNLMCGWPETAGLEFVGLHPV